MNTTKPTIAELQEQIKRLQGEIEKRRTSVIAELREDIEQMLRDEDVTILDVFPELANKPKLAATSARKRVGSDVAAKYKDPVSGALWSGRGRSPKWVSELLETRGISIQEFKASSEFCIS